MHTAKFAICLVILGTLAVRDASGQCDPDQLAKLLPNDGAAGDEFGHAVSVSGDFAFIGAPSDDDNGTSSGSVYVYRWNGSSWVELQKLLASDGVAGDLFGTSVSVYQSRALVGARNADGSGADAGAAYVFAWSGTTWLEIQKLEASDSSSGIHLGSSVAVYDNTALVGAPGSDSVYVFRWHFFAFLEEQKLLASDGTPGDEFGCAIALDGSPGRALIGARMDDDLGSQSGSAYVFLDLGSSFAESQKLVATDGAASDSFGAVVSVRGDVAVVTSLKDDDKGADSGSAHVYRWNMFGYAHDQKLTASDGAAGDLFGSAAGIDATENRILIGAIGRSAAYLFNSDGTDWIERHKLVASDGGDSLGASLSLGSGMALVGASQDSAPGALSGSAYAFDLNLGSWANYGTGWPGTQGIPSLVALEDPLVCGTVHLFIGNSRGANTSGFLLTGVVSGDFPTSWGGHLYVLPNNLAPIPVPVAGLPVSGAVPCHSSLCGLHVYLQVIEVDPGASKGYSFTKGLELILGT